MQHSVRSVPRGFTLIEVMVTVAIVAILSAIALPAYKTYMVRGRIPEGTNALATLQVKMEQYYQDNHTYTGSDAANSYCVTSTLTRFTISCSIGGGGSTFTGTATGIAGTTEAGFVFTIDETGAKATTGVPSGWTSSSNCWVQREDGSC